MTYTKLVTHTQFCSMPPTRIKHWAQAACHVVATGCKNKVGTRLLRMMFLLSNKPDPSKKNRDQHATQSEPHRDRGQASCHTRSKSKRERIGARVLRMAWSRHSPNPAKMKANSENHATHPKPHGNQDQGAFHVQSEFKIEGCLLREKAILHFSKAAVATPVDDDTSTELPPSSQHYLNDYVSDKPNFYPSPMRV